MIFVAFVRWMDFSFLREKHHHSCIVRTSARIRASQTKSNLGQYHSHCTQNGWGKKRTTMQFYEPKYVANTRRISRPKILTKNCLAVCDKNVMKINWNYKMFPAWTAFFLELSQTLYSENKENSLCARNSIWFNSVELIYFLEHSIW